MNNIVHTIRSYAVDALKNKLLHRNDAYDDSLFLPAAEQENVLLLTLDKKMYLAAKEKGNVQML